MRRSLLAGCLVLVSALGAAPASARTLTVPVPLDRTGAVPGTIGLRVSVHRHTTPGAARGTVIALAGGPGQAAAGYASDFADTLGGAGRRWDVVSYDPRGTGRSGRIACPEVERQPFPGVPATVDRCAQRLGDRTALYTTQDAQEDLEAVRAAIGAERVVVYGTSYGTRVAMAYAAAHPARVRGLLLDSTTPAAGIDPLLRSTWRAIPRVLRDLCRGGACRGISRDPARDLARVARRVGLRGSVGTVFRARGRRARVRVTELDLVDLMYAGDFDPIVRSEMPAALRAGARGDLAPLRHLVYDTPGETLDLQSGDSDGLYYATNCEESPFPWSRTASRRERFAQGRAAVAALPRSTWGPFSAEAAFIETDMPSCAGWPMRPSAPPALAGPLPDVPVLVFSGGTDIRTPTADARAVARAFPHSTLVVSRWSGHSVLDGFDDCQNAAIAAFLDGRAVRGCGSPARNPFDNAPAWPASVARSPRYAGIPGMRGRVVGAVVRGLDTLTFPELQAWFEGALAGGGLRGGAWRVDGGGCVSLGAFSVVPGVRSTGRWCGDRAKIRLRVSAGRHRSGTLVFRPGGRVTGVLGGRVVRGTPRPSTSIWSYFGPLGHNGKASAAAARRCPPARCLGRRASQGRRAGER